MTPGPTALSLAATILASSCGGGSDAPSAEQSIAAPQRSEPGAGFSVVAYEELDPVPAGGSLEDLRRMLPRLQGRGVAVALHWKSDDLDDPLRWQVVHEALAYGIAVHPVLTLPEGSEADELPSSPRHAQTGYFPNASNFEAWIAHSKRLMAAWLARGIPPTTMVVDMEMRKRRLHRLADMADDTPDPVGLLLLLASGSDRARQARAIAGFAAYAQHAHALGFRLQLTTLLPMLDDYRDGDDSLRQAFGIPLANDPRDVPYDVVSFQIHRTLYGERYAGLTPFFVYDYARAIRGLFGERAAIDLGLTHPGIVPTAPVYASADELRADVEGALAAGISGANIFVYSLLGMADPARGPLDQWFRPPRSAPPPPADDHVTARSHADWIVLDTLLPGS